jgi:ankyrin repeat protein
MCASGVATAGAKGQLLEQGDKPVADAWIVATREECFGLGHCSTACVEVKVTRTDEQGRYSVGSFFRGRTSYSFYAYKPGYRLDFVRSGELYLVRDERDYRSEKMEAVAARIASLAHVAHEVSCFAAPQEQKQALIPFYRALFQEARSLARAPEQHEVARRICREMFWTQKRPDTSTSESQEQMQQTRFLQAVEPACNLPLDNRREREAMAAVNDGRVADVRQAAAQGLDFNRLLDGRTLPMVIAVQHGNADMVRELAAAGARADAVGEDRRTPLDYAVNQPAPPGKARATMIEALLAAGADPNRRDIWGWPAIVRLARVGGDAASVSVLLKHGARADEKVSCEAFCPGIGDAALHGVADAQTARALLDHGADPNVRSRYRDTPLMNVQRLETARLLLARGADPNAKNQGEWTALMYILGRHDDSVTAEVRAEAREIARALVAAGARLDARNQHGLDPLHYTKDESLKQELRRIAAGR